MMKKLLYIFMCLTMTQACIKENFNVPSNEVTEGEKVSISMSVSVPGMDVATRALGEYTYGDGSHPSLWVVVFDQQGYLVEYAKATEQTLTGGDLHETKFTVELHETPEECIIHYLLNYSDKLEVAYGHESSVIGGLVAGPDKDVYWQRRVLPGVINGDSTYISNNFTRIPLVRNFAKITVTESADNFTLSGFYVLNRPTSATVAPYSNGAFVDYQPALAAGQTLYAALTEAGYVGNEPDGLEFSNTAAPAAVDFSMNATYLYENTAGDENAVTTVLIKGRFGKDTQDTYYKADLLTNDLETGGQTYAHILRNFHYNLNITSVVASGKDIDGAMNAAASNNLSGAVEIKDLTNVTNGSEGLYVSFTDTTLVSSAPIVLKYKFLTDVSDKNSYSNDRVKISAPEGEVVKSTAKGSLITTPATSSWYGYQELIINPQELPDYTRDQTIVLYDEATKLRREVIIRLRPKLNMTVQCDPKVVDAEAGESMTLNIMFEAGLNKALFPLDFAIESQTNASSTSLKQYISPAKTEAISVQTGTSIVPGYTGSKSYQYIKTLSYDDYANLSTNSEGQVIFPVAFVTNIDNSASTVYVRNQYFNDANDFFLNESAALIDGGFYGAGNEVQLVFTATTAGTYTVSSNDLVATKAVSESRTLAAGEVCEMTLYTSDWSDPVSVAISGPSNYSKNFTGVTRNKLAMKAKSILVNGEEYTGYATYGIYTSEASAKALTGSIGTAVSADLKTASGSLLVRDGLAEDNTLWFAYEADGFIWYASATAKQLHEGAVLSFAGIEKPVEMSATLEGEQYYGAGKTVTLNLTTNKAGTYTVTFKEGNSTTTATITVPAGQTTGKATYTTQAFSGAISATVAYTYKSGSTDTINVAGDTRNKLVLGKMTGSSNAPSNNSTSISIRNSSGTSINSVNWSSIKNGGTEVTINGLTDMNSKVLYFQYSSGGIFGMGSTTYKTDTLTAKQAMDGMTLNFNS